MAKINPEHSPAAPSVAPTYSFETRKPRITYTVTLRNTTQRNTTPAVRGKYYLLCLECDATEPTESCMHIAIAPIFVACMLQNIDRRRQTGASICRGLRNP